MLHKVTWPVGRH